MATILSNAHLYLGTSLFGKVNEFKFPDISNVTVDSKPIDSIGTTKLPVGVELDDSSIKLNGFDANVYTKLSNLDEEHIITVRGNLKIFDGNVLRDELPVKGTIKAITNKITALGTLKQQENAEFTVELIPHACKIEYKGQVLSEIDIPNNIWIVDGVDKLSKMKKNLGLV